MVWYFIDCKAHLMFLFSMQILKQDENTMFALDEELNLIQSLVFLENQHKKDDSIKDDSIKDDSIKDDSTKFSLIFKFSLSFMTK